MKHNEKEQKLFYPSQIGYRSLNERTNIARKMVAGFYDNQEEL